MEQDPQSDQGSPSVRSKKSRGGGEDSQKSGVKKTKIKGVQQKGRNTGEIDTGLLGDATPKVSDGGGNPDSNNIDDNKSRLVGIKRKKKRRDEGGRNRGGGLEATNSEIPGSNMIGIDGDNSSMMGAKSGRRTGKAAGDGNHGKK